MTALHGSRTHEHLRDAFAAESRANQRSLWCAQRADIDGHPDVAGALRSMAEGQSGHAHGHLEFLEAVGDPESDLPLGDTDQNLRAVIAVERSMVVDRYGEYAAVARAEDLDEIADWFEMLSRTGRARVERLQTLLDAIAPPTEA